MAILKQQSSSTMPHTTTRWTRRTVTEVVVRILIYAFMSIIALFMMFPFYWAVSMSFTPLAKAFVYPPLWVPDPFTFENYVRLTQVMPFMRFFWNSTLITSSVVIGQLVICSLAGYGFARLPFRGSNLLFSLVLASLMIPSAINIIPLYIMFKNWNWINTFYPLIVPAIFTGSFGAFLMRQFFLTIPLELEEAARIDGASSFTIYRIIMLPLSRPVMAALAIFTFMATWNDFFNPLIFINSKNKMTLVLGLAALRGEFTTEWTVMMAGATVSVIPILSVYVVAQKYFIQGITLTGLKA
jgi:multiple sugar transport system permease protein